METEAQEIQKQVGDTAGRVFSLLQAKQGGAIALDSVRRDVGGPTVVFHMAIGWLAREDRITFSTHGRATMVALKNSQPA